jgi:hypothetical protein
MGNSKEGEEMHGQFVQTSAFLHRELQEFFRAVRRSTGEETLMRQAAERLRAAVHHAEPFGEDPGEAWKCLSMEQRWGYVRVVSFLGTAVQELRRLGISV